MQFISIHEAILNSMSEAVYVIDRNMRIQYANPAAEALTGYSIDESVGMYCGDIFCERSYRCDAQCPPKNSMVEMAPVLHREAETRSKSGEVRQTQISISPFFDNDLCVGAVIVIKDITDLKQAALDREKLILDLQKALQEVKALSGLLPICSSCKKIRDEKGSWNNLEAYISGHSDAEFSHGICPDCAQRLYPEFYKKEERT